MVYYSDNNRWEIGVFSTASAGGCHQTTFRDAENTWTNKLSIIYLYFGFTYLETY